MLVAGAILLALALFARGFTRLRRRRPDRAPWSRPALFALALALGAAALLSPLDSLGEEKLLSAHMLQHVVIGDLVPALLVVALRGPLLFFALPAALLRPVSRLSLLVRPWVAFAVWAGFLAVWHVPAIYDAVLTRPIVHDLEHACFMLGGLLVWTQLVDPARRRALSPAGRIGLLVAMLFAGQMLAAVLVFTYRPIYGAYHGGLGFSPLADQQLAALVMSVEQLLTLGAFAFLALRNRIGAPEPFVLASDRHPVTL